MSNTNFITISGLDSTHSFRADTIEQLHALRGHVASYEEMYNGIPSLSPTIVVVTSAGVTWKIAMDSYAAAVEHAAQAVVH